MTPAELTAHLSPQDREYVLALCRASILGPQDGPDDDYHRYLEADRLYGALGRAGKRLGVDLADLTEAVHAEVEASGVMA